jgi:hypothetical protein
MTQSASGPQWFKSSYSNGDGGECVECAVADDGILVRDTKNHNAGTARVRAAGWQAFVQALRANRL